MQRRIELEILRIVAMLMVVTQHYVSKGEILNHKIFKFSWYFASLLNIVSYSCVLLFVLLTGYFLSYQVEINPIKKIKKIWKKVFFYSWSITLLVYLFHLKNIEYIEIIKSFFPILFRSWGFINNYIFLILLSPMINTYLKNTNKKNLENLIIILTIIQGVLPYIVMRDVFKTGYGNSIVWFVYLYIISYYIRKYRIYEKYSKKIWGIIATLCVMIIFIVKISIAIFTYYIYGKIKYSGAFIGETTILNIIFSISIFCIFLKIQINNYKKTILSLSYVSLDVYLIHEHPAIKDILWKKLNILQTIKLAPGYQVLYWICSISLIYFGIFLGVEVLKTFKIFVYRVYIYFEKNRSK